MRSVAADERYRTHQKVRDDSNPPSRGRYNKCRRAGRRLELCTQVINARRHDDRGGGAVLGGHRGVVCARVSPPEHPSHTLTPSLDVRRRNDAITLPAAALVVGWAPAEPASGYGPNAPCELRASCMLWQRLMRGKGVVVS